MNSKKKKPDKPDKVPKGKRDPKEERHVLSSLQTKFEPRRLEEKEVAFGKGRDQKREALGIIHLISRQVIGGGAASVG